MLSLKITFGNALIFLLSVEWSPSLVSALAQTCRASESGCVNSCLPLAACRATVSAGVSSSFSLLSFVILCLMTFCVYFLHSLQLCVSVCLSPSLLPFPSLLLSLCTSFSSLLSPLSAPIAVSISDCALSALATFSSTWVAAAHLPGARTSTLPTDVEASQFVNFSFTMMHTTVNVDSVELRAY